MEPGDQEKNNNDKKRRNRRRGLKQAAKQNKSPDENQSSDSKPEVRGKKGNSNSNNRRANDDDDDDDKGSKNNGRNNGSNRNKRNSRRQQQPSEAEKIVYQPYTSYEECMRRYSEKDNDMVRGKIRVIQSCAFVSCDRGSQPVDILIPGPAERNRAMDGNTVFCELIPVEQQTQTQELPNQQQQPEGKVRVIRREDLQEQNAMDDDDDDSEDEFELTPWQDDDVQMDLWNPIVPVLKRKRKKSSKAAQSSRNDRQRHAQVVHIVPPRPVASELSPNMDVPNRLVVGFVQRLQSGTLLLTPNNKSLPQFKCPPQCIQGKPDAKTLYRAEYVYDSWEPSHKWPPCVNVSVMGQSLNKEDEIQALLVENDVNHGEHPAEVLKKVDEAVSSGVYTQENGELGWKPTDEMYKGRRDCRSERIFTIDPTTAKDLDDALHIKELPNGSIEVGVHIADVSYFVHPKDVVDCEAQRRATTVYLVDRVIPMLPRPLCEVACSLNENVERLAFSCVWTMNPDGTMRQRDGRDDVWYGRTVIRSCARLDYRTAQNIIDGIVANGKSESYRDDEHWPTSRRPTGGHTMDEVASDVRLMHKVAMARRKLRFDNGALGLHGIKLTFALDKDGETPLLSAPYPIRDSNRLVEEYMLLANFLVAQRLLTHAKEVALLRMHPEPLEDGLDKVAEVAKAAIGFDVDISSSQTLHRSLCELGRECSEPLVLQTVTQMLMTPMQPADYFCVGVVQETELWRHFALNIPYYTHFTSPIRRYADVLVHRLLQASIDECVDKFYLDPPKLNEVAIHCNQKRMASKTAQERCDRIFLALCVKAKPMEQQLAVVVSVGKTAFTAFVPSIGAAVQLFLEEHKNRLTWESNEDEFGNRSILLKQSKTELGRKVWGELNIEIFVKLNVTVVCKEKPPVDVKLRLNGPWTGEDE